MATVNLIEQTYRELTSQGRNILKLFSGNPNDCGFHFPSEILEKAYRDYFSRQDYRPHPKGLLAARRAIQNYYASQGAGVDPEHILLTSGTSESFFHLFSLLARSGDNVLTPNPAYPLFDYVVEMAGVQLRPYHLREEDSWRVDLEDLGNRANEKTKAIVLVSPNNPTGSVLEAGEIAAIVDWANERKIPLICDEVFSEFYFGEGKFPRPMVVAKPDLCFTLNGISKMFALPALKLSWIAVTGKPALVEAAVDRLETTADTFLSCHIPIQETLPLLFQEGWAFVKNYAADVRRRRDLAVTLFRDSPHIKLVDPQGGFYLMARILKKTGDSEEDFVIRLMKAQDVFVHPGYFYDYEDGIHIVLSYLTPPGSLKEGCAKILSCL